MYRVCTLLTDLFYGMKKNEKGVYCLRENEKGGKKMKDTMDLHTHTLASGHAYSTIHEMAEAAALKGLDMLGITEHAPKMPGSCHAIYFSNLRVIPRKQHGLTVLMGVELNIMDYDGTIDLPEEILQEMDLVIASLHKPCIHFGTREENTRAILNVMRNPYLNIIGHPDDAQYPLDYRAVVESAKEHGILLEVNNSSLAPTSFRANAKENYMELLELCREYNQPILIDSDAHVNAAVGAHGFAQELLEMIRFPEELIVNTSAEKVKPYLNYYKNR